MGVFFLDTSVLVKLYVREPGTEQMLRLASRSSGHTLAILALSRVEFRSAVRLRMRLGDITPDAAQQVIGMLERHLRDLYLIHPVTDALIEEAVALLDRHPLRGYDALQLAGCISLRSRVPEEPAFACSDRALAAAARQEGVAVLDPTATVP